MYQYSILTMLSDRRSIKQFVMTKSEIIEAIKVLAEVVKANNGWLGSERLMREANAKIQELLKLL